MASLLSVLVRIIGCLGSAEHGRPTLFDQGFLLAGFVCSQYELENLQCRKLSWTACP